MKKAIGMALMQAASVITIGACKAVVGLAPGSGPRSFAYLPVVIVATAAVTSIVTLPLLVTGAMLHGRG